MMFQSYLGSLGSVLALCAVVASCGTKSGSTFNVDGADSGLDGATLPDGAILNPDGSFEFPDGGTFNLPDGSSSNGGFTINQPALQTLTVGVGQSTPTVQFVGTAGGVTVPVTWVVDQGSIATINASGLLIPTGQTAGVVTVTATYGGPSIEAQINVVLSSTQNGPLAGQALPTSGAGGYGGVGGEGVGTAINDTGIVAALNGTPAGTAASQGITLLYPYNGTVWPQGLLAPLLQWSSSLPSVTGIKIQLTSSNGNFNWTGLFAAPAAVYADGGVGAFIRHPIIQNVWAAATNSTGGANTLTMSLTLATGTGGSALAYGPVTSTWIIAPASLTGTIYYNSYGTGLVTNSGPEGTTPTGQYFGAAVLGIQSGATAPFVVAGTNQVNPSSDDTGCRVCHVVSGGGAYLNVQHGDTAYYSWTSTYNLNNPNPDAGVYLSGNNSTFAWAGLSYDGGLALTNVANMAANTQYTRLYEYPPTVGVAATPLDAGGLPTYLQAGLPVFSADTSHVAFTNLNYSSGSVQVPGLTCTYDCLVGMSFNPATLTFSNPVKLADVPNRVGFASFMPTNDSVVFQLQITNNPGGQYLGTWNGGGTGSGGTGQLYWSDFATGTPTLLKTLNGLTSAGVSYLPTNSQLGHNNDTILNFEPTVNPIASGGYAWAIFTSLRIYGNVATQNAWLNDPRTGGYNYLSPQQICVKKLWVAAIDLNAPAGTDPSHPAFYLPAQEIQAGNARGYWVLSPCQGDGTSCSSGSQCCNGYCSNTGSGGALVCSGKPATATCSTLGNSCASLACCDSTNLCINGFCSASSPPR